MALDKVAVANMALRKVGAAIIKSFSEDSSEARSVLAVYDDILQEVLCEHPWSFAQKRVALATLSTVLAMTEDDLSVVYAKPNDFLKLNAISDPSANYKVESAGILSNTAGLKILYTFKNEDPTTYFPLFTTALATRLASELCFTMSENRNKANDLYTEYENIRLPRALSEDSKQSSPLQAIQDEWAAARFVSGTGIFGRPGQQTFHPPW